MVKASLTGSTLGNILLVLGASMIAGGMKHEQQKFNQTAAEMGAASSCWRPSDSSFQPCSISPPPIVA